MIKHIWSVLCRRSIIDSDSNTITLNEIFEQLQVNLDVKKSELKTENQFNVPLDFEIVNMWWKIDREGNFKGDYQIEAIDPDKKTLQIFTQPFAMPTKMKRLRSRLKIQGMVVTKSGDYIFRVKFKEEKEKEYRTVADIPLEVHVNIKELPIN